MKELENKSFFNKDWSKKQIEDAVNAGYKEALEKESLQDNIHFLMAERM